MTTRRDAVDAGERWLPVYGYANIYRVSSYGRIYNDRAGRFLGGAVSPKGYITICLCCDGYVERRTLHRIVARAFLGMRPPGMQIDHIDGAPGNNRASNLRYVTPQENISATVARGAQALGIRNGQAGLTLAQVAEIRAAKTGKRFWGCKEFAKRFGVDRTTITRAAAGATYCAAAIRALKSGEDK